MEYFFRNSEFLEIIQTSSKIEHTKYLKYLSSFKNIHARMDNYRLHCYVMARRATRHLVRGGLGGNIFFGPPPLTFLGGGARKMCVILEK